MPKALRTPEAENKKEQAKRRKEIRQQVNEYLATLPEEEAPGEHRVQLLYEYHYEHPDEIGTLPSIIDLGETYQHYLQFPWRPDPPEEPEEPEDEETELDRLYQEHQEHYREDEIIAAADWTFDCPGHPKAPVDTVALQFEIMLALDDHSEDPEKMSAGRLGRLVAEITANIDREYMSPADPSYFKTIGEFFGLLLHRSPEQQTKTISEIGYEQSPEDAAKSQAHTVAILDHLREHKLPVSSPDGLGFFVCIVAGWIDPADYQMQPGSR